MNNPLFNDVRNKYHKKNQILFNKDSLCLEELLSRTQLASHRCLILWSFHYINLMQKDLKDLGVEDKRIDRAINLSMDWAKGKIKMPVAKKALLEVHSMAKETNDKVVIAKLHAIGQGLSSIHVKTHAIGLAIYELTSIVLQNGIDSFENSVSHRIDDYLLILEECEKTLTIESFEWAKFLVED